MDTLRKAVRAVVRLIAKVINSLTRGQLKPDYVTMLSLLGHFLIFWMIIGDHTLRAGGLLIVFGLMDALDGELARLQGSAGSRGMILDASSDRIKEGLLFSALVYRFAYYEEPVWAMIVALTLCGAFAVSYIKAKGETAIASKMKDANKANRIFQDGFMRYEARMALLVVGLFYAPIIKPVICIIGILSWLTATYRLQRITSFFK